MKKFIREFFFLRRGERRSLLLVTALLIFIIVLRLYWVLKAVPELEIDQEFLLAMKSLQEEISFNSAQPEIPGFQKVGKMTPVLTTELFYFDPNNISFDSLKLLKLTDHVVRNIISYRKAGGKFKVAEDLIKIYGMDSLQFSRLRPYLRIQEKEAGLSISKYPNFRDEVLERFDINSADSAQLTIIPGIGPSWSGRIIKYRELLGGYYQSNQLWEVYGMDSMRYNSIVEYCSFDTVTIRKIDLNSATFKTLISHPYMTKSATYAILQYREFVDSIKSIVEIDMNQILDHERFIRMAPYLGLGEEKISIEFY